MIIDMEFKGLDELVRAFEKAASDSDVRKVNKRIIEKSQPIVKKIMSKKIPKSSDISKSGRGFGTKSSVSAHAADEIPVSKVRMRTSGVGAAGNVGWEKSDNSEHFYVKFINWGTIYRPPKEFLYASSKEADKELQKIAEQEYQAYLNNTIK